MPLYWPAEHVSEAMSLDHLLTNLTDVSDVHWDSINQRLIVTRPGLSTFIVKENEEWKRKGLLNSGDEAVCYFQGSVYTLNEGNGYIQEYKENVPYQFTKGIKIDLPEARKLTNGTSRGPEGLIILDGESPYAELFQTNGDPLILVAHQYYGVVLAYNFRTKAFIKAVLTGETESSGFSIVNGKLVINHNCGNNTIGFYEPILDNTSLRNYFGLEINKRLRRIKSYAHCRTGNVEGFAKGDGTNAFVCVDRESTTETGPTLLWFQKFTV